MPRGRDFSDCGSLLLLDDGTRKGWPCKMAHSISPDLLLDDAHNKPKGPFSDARVVVTLV